ncbi:MAG: hypothetical protein KatS3mg124_1049 [Porticoccaceae bacterium]|nr:MAG: hypothetical protein KatS3mg124_1049 [Porticoccaceae bacterium]
MEEIRVLLVEDDAAEAELLGRDLRRIRTFSCRWAHVATLAEALRALEKSSWDLVLLDYHLPDCRGLAGLDAVLRAGGDAAVVVLTHHAEEETALEALRRGAQDWLPKGELTASLLERAIRYARERQRVLRALAASEERYALAVDGANDAIWDYDALRDRIHISRRLYELLGLAEGVDQERPAFWFARVHPDDRPRVARLVEALLLGALPRLEMEYRLRGADGSYLWVLCRGVAVCDESGRARRAAGSLTDLSARKQLEEKLLHDAFHDPLTGLPNRQLFLDRTRQALAAARRRVEERCAVIFVDLDRFKQINDSLGHAVGDAFLIAVAARLAETLRAGDTLARLGGDEFAFLLRGCREGEDALAFARRIRESFAAPFVAQGAELHLDASLGIALGGGEGESAEDLLRQADIAMYRAKRGGRGIEMFDRDMHLTTRRRLELDARLRRAFEAGEFVLHYQPILTTGESRLIGLEALLRWQAADGEARAAEAFIAAAEETGLLVPLGWWVLDRALQEFAALLPNLPPPCAPRLAVNISAKWFAEEPDTLVNRLGDLLERHAVSPHRLCLEVTEHAVLEQGARVLDTLARLRRLGVAIHVDDFGTGYASLSQLRSFPFDAIKIDRSFVAELEGGGESAAIVSSLVTLGTALGMEVVAEGVEREGQLDALRALGCPQVQGFLFSPAVPAARLPALAQRLSGAA